MKKFFNMIEVTLAIAVVGLGMVTIMSLFPVGVQASRDAVGDNYASDSVEQILAYLGAECQKDWSTYIGNSDITGSIRASATSPITDSDITVPIVGRVANTNLFATSIGSPVGSVFCIKQPATGNPDFVAHIRIWKAQIANMTLGNNIGVTIPYDYAARICAEVSWPVEKPYSKRTKRIYVLELFKQN